MLPNLRFSRYRFAYSVQEPLKMPEHKGNVFRGRLGYILRRVACVGDEGECKNHCDYPDRCVYSGCFETPVPDDSPLLQGNPFAPHPFILEPPGARKLRYEPGDTFACTLVLIGEAIDLLPWLVYAFSMMGEKRIGLQGERGRCKLETVESLPARRNLARRTIYTAEDEILTDAGFIVDAEEALKDAPHVTSPMELEFLTPTSIKVRGDWATSLSFDDLIRNLLRRLRLLSFFHCGADFEVDAPTLIKAAEAVKRKSNLRWVRKDRWSYRTESPIPMGGFIGKVKYKGDIEPFLPLIFLGEYLHIGHHTAFGFGQYRIST